MKPSDRDKLEAKIESEGFDYAIREYGGNIKDPKYNLLREAYLKAGQALATYLEVDLTD